MRRLIIAVSLLVVGIGVAYSQEPQEMKELSVKPKDGFVPNAETAVKIGEAVLIPYSRVRRKEDQPGTAIRGDAKGRRVESNGHSELWCP